MQTLEQVLEFTGKQLDRNKEIEKLQREIIILCVKSAYQLGRLEGMTQMAQVTHIGNLCTCSKGKMNPQCQAIIHRL